MKHRLIYCPFLTLLWHHRQDFLRDCNYVTCRGYVTQALVLWGAQWSEPHGLLPRARHHPKEVWEEFVFCDMIKSQKCVKCFIWYEGEKESCISVSHYKLELRRELFIKSSAGPRQQQFIKHISIFIDPNIANTFLMSRPSHKIQWVYNLK